MPAAVTGSVFSSTGITQDGSVTSITIPTDAQACIVAFSSFDVAVFDALCWDAGSTVDFTEIVTIENGDDSKMSSWIMTSASSNWPGSGSGKTLTFSFTTTLSTTDIVVWFVKDIDTSDPINSSAGAEDSAYYYAVTITASGTNDLSFICAGSYSDTQDGDYSGQTSIYETPHLTVAYELAETSLATDASGAAMPPEYWAVGFSLNYAAAVSVSLEQEGFRWRNDNGSEITATWRQNQDVDDTIAIETNIRLRVLINATSDPATKQYKLQYKRTAGATWKDVAEQP